MTRLKLLETFHRDLLYALRIMRKNPGFAAAAVLTLALGIGETTAMFTVIRSVLLKPLPYPNPERLVQLSRGSTSVRFREMKSAARSYSGLGIYLNNAFDVTISGAGEPEVRKGVSVSGNFLDILGIRPLLGRGFRPDEDKAGGLPVAVISETLWRSRFAGDPGILNRTVILTGTPYAIIGVLPAGFRFPFTDIDVWITRPTQFINDLSPLLTVFGRLNPGVSIEQATSELAVLNQHYRAAHPGMLDGKTNVVEVVVSLRDRLVDNVRVMLWMLFGAVGFVLLIACANVASLLLARAALRSREFAVRVAIGASRSRIINQLLVESTALSVVAGLLGIILARWILVGTSHMTALQLPRAGEIQLDNQVLVFAIVLSIATGVLFGLIPSLGASRPDVASVLRASGEAASSTGKKRVALGLSPRGALVIAQVALSMVLLIGAALLMESLARLGGIDPGFDSSHLLTLHVSLAPSRYSTAQKQAAFFDNLARRVETLPRVRGAGASFTVPMTIFPMTPVQLASEPLRPLNQRPLAAIQNVTTDYFRTLQVPLRRGREFTAHDDAKAPLTAIINESLARLFWPAYPNGIDPVGQRIVIGARPDPVEVVGIVANAHQLLESNPSPAVYRPFDQYPIPNAAFLVRTSGDPHRVVPAIRDQVRAMDRDEAISEVQTMDDLIAAEGGQRRVILILLGGFASAALLLALFGIYSVIAYSVTQRTQELGIRRALGAQDADILRLMLGQGLGLTLAGIALGIAGALALTRFMTSLLFHTSPVDPATFSAIALLFVLVASAAVYIPARRAARIDPMAAIRM